jgi:hypothetical protein
MEARDIVICFIAPDDPTLARRILSLLWSYERAQLRHRLLYQPLRRRQRERQHTGSELTGVDQDPEKTPSSGGCASPLPPAARQPNAN